MSSGFAGACARPLGARLPLLKLSDAKNSANKSCLATWCSYALLTMSYKLAPPRDVVLRATACQPDVPGSGVTAPPPSERTEDLAFIVGFFIAAEFAGDRLAGLRVAGDLLAEDLLEPGRVLEVFLSGVRNRSSSAKKSSSDSSSEISAWFICRTSASHKSEVCRWNTARREPSFCLLSSICCILRGSASMNTLAQCLTAIALFLSELCLYRPFPLLFKFASCCNVSINFR
mmetsp:Transcript_13655/g.22551  ORF Transcript_13655/g.22551 Transcript_13655/m.22551 type:complete len:231 (+) Transcript_13655:233-925(+)